jgi:hypothetical protein
MTCIEDEDLSGCLPATKRCGRRIALGCWRGASGKAAMLACVDDRAREGETHGNLIATDTPTSLYCRYVRPIESRAMHLKLGRSP